MGKLIIVRHHASDWNIEGLWQGERDRHLTEHGFNKSEEMGFLIKNIHIDYAFASMLVRSIETLSSMLMAMEQYKVPTVHSGELNERDYGDFTAKNKWDVEKLIGENEFDKLRREWNYPVPNGETLKMVYDRAVPFYLHHILTHVKEGQNVLVVSHGNTIRALMKYIENIPDDKIKDVEMLFGEVVIYNVDDTGHMINKEIRKIKSQVPA